MDLYLIFLALIGAGGAAAAAASSGGGGNDKSASDNTTALAAIDTSTASENGEDGPAIDHAGDTDGHSKTPKHDHSDQHGSDLETAQQGYSLDVGGGVETPRQDHSGDKGDHTQTPKHDHSAETVDDTETTGHDHSDETGDPAETPEHNHSDETVDDTETTGHDHSSGTDDPAETPEHNHSDETVDDTETTGHDHSNGTDDPADTPEHNHSDETVDDVEPTGHDHSDHGGDTTTSSPPPPEVDQAAIDAYVAAIRQQSETHVHGDDDDRMAEHESAMNLVPRDEATHIAVSDGDWFDSATWYNGLIPPQDASVLIPEGINVHYAGVSETSLFTVRVDGELEFATDVDSKMVFDTMVVSPTGSLIIGTEIDPVAADVTVDLVIANNGPIDVEWDPDLLSRGVISHGETSIHGAEKETHDKVIEDPMAGDTSVVFDDAPEGWAVGDTIVIAGTHYEGYKWDNDIRATRHYESEDEVRVISMIEGNEVFFADPLEHDHDTPRDDLYTSVANYSRNVTIQTEDPDTAEIHERGHVMFMHSDDVDVRYAAFHELGRTDKSETSKPSSDFATVESDTNVQGRYALHLHRTGVENADDPAIVVGNAVWGSPGWGYVHHDSHALLEGNASYDTYGAGFVAETGNETGAWTDNIAISAQGISWGAPKNASDVDGETFDTAKGGHGFWFQGRLVDSVDNVAASVNTGFVYFHRDYNDSTIDFDSSLFAYPEALDYETDVRADDTPILNFSGNETFASKEGLHIVKANPDQGHDVWSHLDDFTAWSVVSGAHIEYTSRYILRDFDVIGKEPTPFSDAQTGISLGNNTSEIVIIDAQVSGFQTGIDLDKNFVGDHIGEIGDHNFVVINPDITDVEQNYANYDPAYDDIREQFEAAPTDVDLQITAPLVYDSGATFHPYGGAVIEATKTDSLGETDLSGTDTFHISRENVASILENQGYWTTSEDEAYFLYDIYTTDRQTGDIYFETHPVYLSEEVIPLLGNPYFQYSDAKDNGVQDITEGSDGRYAGDELLDTAILAEQPAPHPSVATLDQTTAAQELLAALSFDPETMSAEDGLHHHMEDEDDRELVELV